MTISVVLDGCVILGLTVDKKLRFGNHTTKIISTEYFNFKAIFRYKNVLRQKLKWQFATFYFKSNILLQQCLLPVFESTI